jgi:hypothetical protein
MIKKTFFLLFLFALFAQSANAGELIKISSLEGDVLIKNPTGDSFTYKSLEQIPELSYGSRINVVSGHTKIKIFDTAEVFVEQDQGIFITKNPITNAVGIKKRESNNPKLIKVSLADRAQLYFGADTLISITELHLQVISGKAVIKSFEGKMHTMEAGDRYIIANKILQD